LSFVSENKNAIIYPVGKHIAIRELFASREEKKNDIIFIYNDNDLEKMTSMNVSNDRNLLLVCEKKERTAVISIYNLCKINFNSVTIHKPKRRIISTLYSYFKYASFTQDGNYIVSIGVVPKENGFVLQGLIWDIQIFQPYKDDNYKPKCIFEVPNSVTKITIENKIICASGFETLTFWNVYETSVREFKTGVKNLTTSHVNFADHSIFK
jgi:hypothetical protein